MEVFPQNGYIQVMIPADPSTSLSMLERVCRNDAEAWERFCSVYAPLVYRWARVAGLQDSDAADVGQDVFRTVFLKVADYDGRQTGATFRGWLRTITRNKIGDHWRKQSSRQAAVGGTTAWEIRKNVPDPLSEDDSFAPGEERQVLHRTLETLKIGFESQTWQAFWMSTVDDLPAAEVAERLGMSPVAVRQAKFRVLRRLRDELQTIEQTGPDS